MDNAFWELRMPAAEEDGADWREQLRRLAAGYRALLVRHPWLSPPAGRFQNIGPNALAFSRCVQRVIHRAGPPAHRVTSAPSAVCQYVYGYGTHEGRFRSRIADSGLTPDAHHEQAVSEVRRAPRAADGLRESGEVGKPAAGTRSPR